jgi:hypothetical protein
LRAHAAATFSRSKKNSRAQGATKLAPATGAHRGNPHEPKNDRSFVEQDRRLCLLGAFSPIGQGERLDAARPLSPASGAVDNWLVGISTGKTSSFVSFEVQKQAGAFFSAGHQRSWTRVAFARPAGASGSTHRSHPQLRSNRREKKGGKVSRSAAGGRMPKLRLFATASAAPNMSEFRPDAI